jgi:hypothetical protein
LTTKTHQDLVKKLFNKKYHSVFLAVLGPNQSGKTVLAIYLMLEAYKLGLYKYFGCNIPDLDLGFEYDFIEDLVTLKQRCQMLNANGVNRYLFLADEMGDWAPQDQPWLNVKFIRELQKVRKYGLSLIGCGIGRIDARILSPSYFHGKFVKRSKTQQSRAVYEDWTNYPRIRSYSIKELPDVKIEGFDTYYPAMFYMEPQGHDHIKIPLSPEHEIVKRYLKAGSWKAADVHPQEGKRAVRKVLNYHLKYCLHELPKDKETPEITSSQIAS